MEAFKRTFLIQKQEKKGFVNLPEVFKVSVLMQGCFVQHSRIRLDYIRTLNVWQNILARQNLFKFLPKICRNLRGTGKANLEKLAKMHFFKFAPFLRLPY